MPVRGLSNGISLRTAQHNPKEFHRKLHKVVLMGDPLGTFCGTSQITSVKAS